MIITKQNLEILRYIYKKKTASYLSIQNKFKIQVKEILEMLEYNHYVIQIGGSQNNYGEPVEFTETTMFKLDVLGLSVVESKQWFNLQYVISQIFVPIIIAIITTLLTIFLSALL